MSAGLSQLLLGKSITDDRVIQLAVGVTRLDNVVKSKDKVFLALLHDNLGKVLVLFPASDLLNLVILWRETDRQLQSISPQNLIKFFKQEALMTTEGQRKLFSLPVYIDRSLNSVLQFDALEPHSGLTFSIPKQWLENTVTVLPLSISQQEINDKQPKGSDEEVVVKAVERFTALRIKQRVSDTLGLPSLSPTVQKISELRSDPLADVSRLVPIVKVDPSLASQVMSWAASPYYATPSELQSIEDAVSRVLGFDLVINLALGVSMGKTLSVPKDAPRGHTPYWLQALYSATLAERLCKKMNANDAPKPGLVYLTGLIHNFGYAVLGHLFPSHFVLLSRYLEANPHISIEQTEKQILNVTREQVAAWLFECWSLPEEVCLGVRYINSPMSSESNTYAQLVNLANRALRSSGFADGPIEALDKNVLQAVGLLEEEVFAEREAMLTKEDELLELVKMLERQQRRETAKIDDAIEGDIS